MGRIGRDVIDTVRERLDIATVVGQVVTLKKKGSSLVGLCPFHQEKTPSFNVVPAKGIYHCFGCGEGGDAFQFLMKTRGIPFADAVRELAHSVGIEVQEEELTAEEVKKRKARATLYDVCEAARGWFRAMLEARSEGADARAYLSGRGLLPETLEGFAIGFAPDRWDGLLNHLHKEGFDTALAVRAGLARWRDPERPERGAYDLFRGRIIVPVEDDRGRLVAFGGRVLPGAVTDGRDAPPKYVNSPETDIYQKSNVLYALPKARPAIQRRDRAIVVEGYFDVIALHQAGFAETVATCGTALTAKHLETLRRLTRTVVAQFDADAAGENAATRSLPMFLEAGIEPLRMDLGEHKDPDELVQAKGSDAFEHALSRAEPLFELVLRRAIHRHGVTPGGKERTLAELAPILRVFPEVSRPVAIERVAQAVGLTEPVVAATVGHGRPDRAAPPPATRWNGTHELNHLLWMLVHYPDRVAPILVEANPEALTDRPSARQAMGLFLMGRSLTDVIQEVDDPELARVLRHLAGEPKRYESEQIERATLQILQGFRRREIELQLRDLNAQLAGCDPSSEEFRHLTSKKVELWRERGDLSGSRGGATP
jgi:DNA primase